MFLSEIHLSSNSSTRSSTARLQLQRNNWCKWLPNRVEFGLWKSTMWWSKCRTIGLRADLQLRSIPPKKRQMSVGLRWYDAGRKNALFLQRWICEKWFARNLHSSWRMQFWRYFELIILKNKIFNWIFFSKLKNFHKIW